MTCAAAAADVRNAGGRGMPRPYRKRQRSCYAAGMADERKIGWGILGTGNIARQFCSGVRGCERGVLLAVGSRTAASAAEFAGQYAISKSYPTYEQVLSDKQVDAVYISLPNSMHCEWTIKALEAGKHVLCEKPVA